MNFYRKLFSFIILMSISVTSALSKDKYDLTSPEKVINLFFQINQNDTKIARNIFVGDYKKFSYIFENQLHESSYKIVKIFKSINGPDNLSIALVKVKNDGSLYYIIYFENNHSKYYINDLDRAMIPNPADFPNIEQQLISSLSTNYKAFKIKK